MAGSQRNTRNRKSAGGSLTPYLFHFMLFVAVFFVIIGGALFILNIASAYGA